MKTILVTGSKGYIGSHAVRELDKHGYKIVGIDLFLNSHNNIVINNEKFYEGDIRDKDFLNKIFSENNIDLIMHFAAVVSVKESMENPELYMDINHSGTMNLLKVAQEHKVNNIIFSSTAAVYGNASNFPIKEDDIKKPINPYGKSKLKAEKSIFESNMKYCIFRYFNVAGSGGEGLGYFPKAQPSHIIPIINNVANSNSLKFNVFGNDYKTKDGTCIRDYIHVKDLIMFHIAAAEKMLNDEPFESSTYNISLGKGYSVMDVYNEANKFYKKIIPINFKERREGDPDILFASPVKAEKYFGIKAKYTLKDMIESDFASRFK